MAIIKIYTKKENYEELFEHVAKAIKLVGSAVLNVEGFETIPGSVETVYIEAIDIIGIDYICEIIGVKRPDEQSIADNFIAGMNEIYPNKLFSVYFVYIDEMGMSNTPREKVVSSPISLNEAVAEGRNLKRPVSYL